MTKHLSFWLGVFAAALLTVPIAASIMGAAEQELRRIAVTVFVVVAALVVVLVIALFFRDWILRRLFGRAEATLDEVSASLIAGVSAATAGDRAAATQHAQDVVQRGMGWYAWTGFYRWVIATAVALLLAFGAFMGTVLLFEQNRKLGEQTEVLRVQSERLAEQTGFMAAQTELMQAQTERLREQTEAAAMQNEIMALNLVNEIRNQMLATIETKPLRDWLRKDPKAGWEEPLFTFEDEQQSCALGFNLDYELSSAPSAATLGAILALAKSPALGESVIEALQLLVEDTHGGVVLGALYVLEDVAQSFRHPYVWVENVIVRHGVGLHHFQSQITFTSSYLNSVSCTDCELHAGGSYVAISTMSPQTAAGSVLVNMDPKQAPHVGLSVMLKSDVPGEGWFANPIDLGPYFFEFESGWGLSGNANSETCNLLTFVDRLNPLLQKPETK
ncbi:MAG: hypothetical protein AAFQ58_07335 [Pseudomonadota bacterium]